MKQQKTGELVELPVGQETVDNVAPLAFLLTHQGRPYTAKGLGNAVKDWCRTAGIPHCSAHTIRKSTLTLLADKGRTMHEIAAYGGHRSLRMVETYTKKANQLHLARAAAKAFEDESRTEMSTVPVEGYTKEKKA